MTAFDAPAETPADGVRRQGTLSRSHSAGNLSGDDQAAAVVAAPLSRSPASGSSPDLALRSKLEALPNQQEQVTLELLEYPLGASLLGLS